MTLADKLNTLWRPIGSFAVVINVFLMPWAMVSMACLNRGVQHLPSLVAVYMAIVGLFGALFGIRQFGKNAKLEANKDLHIAKMMDD